MPEHAVDVPVTDSIPILPSGRGSADRGSTPRKPRPKDGSRIASVAEYGTNYSRTSVCRHLLGDNEEPKYLFFGDGVLEQRLTELQVVHERLRPMLLGFIRRPVEGIPVGL